MNCPCHIHHDSISYSITHFASINYYHRLSCISSCKGHHLIVYCKMSQVPTADPCPRWKHRPASLQLCPDGGYPLHPKELLLLSRDGTTGCTYSLIISGTWTTKVFQSRRPPHKLLRQRWEADLQHLPRVRLSLRPQDARDHGGCRGEQKEAE